MPKHWTESEKKIALNPNLTSPRVAQLLENKSISAICRFRSRRGVKTSPAAKSAAISEAIRIFHARRAKARAAQAKKQEEPQPTPKHAWTSVFSADDRLLGLYHPSQHLRIEKYRAKVRVEPKNVSSDVHAVCATSKTAKAGSATNASPAL